MCSSTASRRTSSPPASHHSPMPRRTGRRPKYLSLRRRLARPDSLDISTTTTSPPAAAPDVSDHHFLDRDPNVAYLLEPDDTGGAVSLVALLGAAAAPDPLSSPSPVSSSSVSWDGDEDDLARRALRGRERSVFCSSSSSSPPSDHFDLLCGVPPQTLSLKLDYQEILAAWSDRGSFYIDAPQAVPELYDTTVFVEVGSGWRVPDVAAVVKEEELEKAGEGKGVVPSREERVMRYKEKRRRRLFAKRIRYEVRKLNADKRPRMKGRFVKRKDDE